VLNDNVNSELIELADGVYVALRLLNFAASEPKKLEVVSDEIKTKLIAERATAAAEEAGDSLIKRASQNWQALADDETVAINNHTVSMIDTDRKVANDVMREVVKMRLNNGEAVINSFTGVNGDFNILRLHKIAPGDLTKVSQQIKDSTRTLIEQRNGQALFRSYMDGLNKSMDIKVNEDLL